MSTRIAAIADHEHIIVVVFAAMYAGLVLILFLGNLEEHGRIQLGDLLTIFDGIGRDCWA